MTPLYCFLLFYVLPTIICIIIGKIVNEDDAEKDLPLGMCFIPILNVMLPVGAATEPLFLKFIAWYYNRKPESAKQWECNRCKSDVVEGKCKCETSPSPWKEKGSVA
jgi:hypothetical protein